MNITEANAVARVLAFLADLDYCDRLDELDVDETKLPDDVGFLAGRVRAALGAGPDPDVLARRVEDLLFVPEEDGCAFEDDARAVEDVLVPGGQL
jgi:hypothetical protein